MANCILYTFRQQSSEEGHDLRSRVQSAEALLAQKRQYQKHLRSLQQSSLARDILQGRPIILRSKTIFYSYISGSDIFSTLFLFLYILSTLFLLISSPWWQCKLWDASYNNVALRRILKSCVVTEVRKKHNYCSGESLFWNQVVLKCNTIKSPQSHNNTNIF